MIHIKKLDDAVPLFKTLGSAVRISIIKLLVDQKELSMNEIAKAVGITNGALTSHVRMLEESGLIVVLPERSQHGNKKVCRLKESQILLDIGSENYPEDMQNYDTEIRIGHYTDCKILPTCGLATDKVLVGEVDDPRYFAHPDRINAGILWFGRGHVEYMIPNLLPKETRIDKLTLSFEISSEAPGVNNDWPSDITFFLNDTRLGTWTSAGDYGDVQGIFTPDWWPVNWNQYGLLKVLTIDSKGCHIDGLKISDVTIRQLKLDYKSEIRFRFQIMDDALHIGGMTLFGAGFGNYGQDIKVHIAYRPTDRSV